MTLEGITNDGVEWELAFSGGDQSDVITHTLICAAESAASAAAIDALTKLGVPFDLEFSIDESSPTDSDRTRLLPCLLAVRPDDSVVDEFEGLEGILYFLRLFSFHGDPVARKELASFAHSFRREARL